MMTQEEAVTYLQNATRLRASARIAEERAIQSATFTIGALCAAAACWLTHSAWAFALGSLAFSVFRFVQSVRADRRAGL